MKKENIKKVVLAYSGGLDTSIIIPWLKENYNNCEVIAVSGDVGQGTELDGLEEKALKTGASKLYVMDLTKEFVDDYIIPTMKAGATYEQYFAAIMLLQPRDEYRSIQTAGICQNNFVIFLFHVFRPRILRFFDGLIILPPYSFGK